MDSVTVIYLEFWIEIAYSEFEIVYMACSIRYHNQKKSYHDR
jgi:hypothetical protein